MADSRVSDCLHALQKRVSCNVRQDAYSKVLYSTDASIFQAEPHAVVLPRSLGDVHAVVECAAEHEVAVLPRTGGSSLAGQAVNEAIVVDFTRHLNKIIEVDEAARTARVQPGIVLDELNLQLGEKGLKFGPDPASSNRAAIGGIVSNNSTGSHSILYGMTADHVESVRVILSDGSRVEFGPEGDGAIAAKTSRPGVEGSVYRWLDEVRASEDHAATIRTSTPRHWRRCGGYNLDRIISQEGINFLIPQPDLVNSARLICGSEGTLAVIEDVTLNLVALPSVSAIALVHFDDLQLALRAVEPILEIGPSAVELVDNLGLTLCREVPEYARLLDSFLDGAPDCMLITEFYGDSVDELKDKIASLKQHLKAVGAGATGVVPVLEPSRQADVWKVRKVGLGLLMSIRGDAKPIPFIEDAAVPVQHLPEYIQKLEKFCTGDGSRMAIYAHASAGCLHVRPLINAKRAEELAKIPEIMHFAIDLLHGYGGALSSEHGDGRSRSAFNRAFFGDQMYTLFEKTKAAFDPGNIFNPGMIVNPHDPVGSLRFGPDYKTEAIKEQLDFSSDGGFARAIEMCNGAGVCRKLTTGTMCPSFMVTREEEHSTRGRANALRAAMSGKLGSGALQSERMYGVMDLCLGCKACKSECPSSVDMAKIKTEFLAQYYDKHGVPGRTRFFADVAKTSRRLSGPLAAIANGFGKQRAVRKILHHSKGVHWNRSLPEFARQDFLKWHRRNRPKSGRNGAQKVVLFHDTFSTYYEPEIAIAAYEFLDACGLEVILPGHYCCGRPLISAGLVDEARSAAKHTVGVLARYARAGVPIVGLEPSCILSFGDEYLDLLPGDEDATAVSENAYLFESWVEKLSEEDSLPPFTQSGQKLLFHGHCHQKALVGTTSARKVLALPKNYVVEEVDSGCCGMAGTFGYEKEHYDISMRIGGMRLFPAVRAEDPDSVIVAPGTSCRQQIVDGTGRKAKHPAEVLRDALA